MKNIFTIVVMTVWFYFMPIHALKAETLEFVFSDFPPFEYVEGRSVKGINKEMLEEACLRLNITPVFLKLPWKRALAYVKHGNGDAIFSLFKNEERLKYYNYPDENLNNVKMVLIMNKESEIKTLSYVITMKPTYVAFSKAKEKRTKKDWSIQFSSILKEMKNDGFIEALDSKYRF